MKKLLLIMIFIILFSSCSKEESDNSNDLKRKWYPVESSIDGIVHPYDDHEDCGKDYLQFYGVNSVKFVDIFDCEPETDWTGTYSRSQNSLTITVLGENKTFNIIELSNILVLEYTFDNNNDGIVETYRETYSKN